MVAKGFYLRPIDSKTRLEGIKRVCLETNEQSACIASTFVFYVGEDQGINRVSLNKKIIVAEKDLLKVRASYPGQVLLPLTYRLNSGLCVPVLLGLTLPFDAILLPFTYPIAEGIRQKIQSAAKRTLDDSSNGEVRFRNEEYFFMTKELLRNI
jgi:hypothetical protein